MLDKLDREIKENMKTFEKDLNSEMRDLMKDLEYQVKSELEVTFKDYREKVDMWAIGIIMHNVLTGNKHPFHVSGEDPAQFKATLKKLTKVTEDPNCFSYLSSSLF